MNEITRWAVVGPGRIAHRFAQAVAGLPDARLARVQARDWAKGQAFAAQWTAADAPAVLVSPDLAHLLAQPDVDAVYIATPHSAHGPAIEACLRAGKPVLCEKSLVPTRAQAEPLVALARERGVFLMEAVWTRFLPLYAQVGEWLRSQALGELRGLQSTFCFHAPFNAASRLYAPELAGGTLLDIGIYNLSVTQWVLQQAWGACPEPTTLWAQGRRAPTGVDQRVAGTLVFGDGDRAVPAQFLCAFDGVADNGFTIVGERGHIRIPQHFHRGTQAVLQVAGAEAVVVDAPFPINGFEGEIREAMRCMRAGLVESPTLPHAHTLAVLGWMDRLRQQLGVRYPFE
jgi:predicted dehydrogenase